MFVMERLRWAGACAAGLLCAAAHASDCGSLDSLDWLIGDWAAESQESRLLETWRALGPGNFQGATVRRSRMDGAIRHSEDLRLLRMGDGVFYVAKVPENDLPVAFRLNACEGGVYAFENAAHDFPRRIEYRRGAGDTLSVRVSDGADEGFTLEFRRLPTSAPAGVLADEDARFAAMVSADAAAMERWLAPDLVYIHSTGQVQSRAELVAGIVGRRMRYVDIMPAEREVIGLAPDAALVRGHGRFQVAAGDAALDMQVRYLAVYALREGRWQLRAWQSLRVQ